MMQVTPVSAIHELRIRQKPQETHSIETEPASTNSGRFADMAMAPLLVASAAMRETYHGAHAEYAAQLLANDVSHAETSLERQSQLQHYSALTAYEDDERSHTISLSA
ncbi:hypothetical protein ABVF61_27820 [Roseibium sp. HPY-6]|uniref:hypothetical protein n=1 Tax=Roseibium sp. HPY-6 TaxID=3229852 RepID=UPI00338FF4DE